MTSYRAREAAAAVLRALKDMPVVVLTGMRQTGKTTLLRQDSRFKDRRYLTFDDFAQLEAARENPEALLQGDDPITIDEAQKCPELFTAIKKSVDLKRKPGRILLSGSANLSLLKNVSESLAGRAVHFTLQPFNRRELRGDGESPAFIQGFFESVAPAAMRKGAAAIFKFSGGTLERTSAERASGFPLLHLDRLPAPVDPAEILRGGMPSVCLGEVGDPAVWFQGFEQTYLERDLRGLAQVADLVSFRHLMRLAALRTGQILNQSDIGRDAKLNAMTASRYLGLLETSFLISRLTPVLGSRGSRLTKAPKLLFSDTGMAAHLAGVTDIDPTSDDPMRGPLFETYVAQNLIAILGAHWPDARLHYWNLQGRHEVDFVIESGRDSIAIEVKAATRWTDRDLAGLEAFMRGTPGCRAGILLHNGQDAVHLRDRLWALPMGLLVS